MLKEIGHFMRISKELVPLQKQHSRAEFAEIVMSRSDARGFADVRRALVGDLTGRVLDVGCGTGRMFEHYGPDAQVEGIEPEEDFLALAMAKAGSYGGRIRAMAGDAMRLPFPDGSFDAVVFGLVLCSVPSMEQVSREALRVLRVGGQLRAVEHVRSENPVAGFLMNVTNPVWMRLNRQGCRWNRNPLGAVERAGFRIDEVLPFKSFDLLVPAFPVRRVRAHRPGPEAAVPQSAVPAT